MSTLRIALFGRLTISRGERGVELPAKPAELLCYLLLQRGRPQSREALATVLWGEASAAQGKKYLRQTLWQLQQALEGDGAAARSLLRLDRDWVAVDEGAALSVDAYRLDDICAPLANLAAGRLEPLEASAAAELYRGELLEGWYHEWCLVERERYHALYACLLEHLLEHCAAEGRLPVAIALGLRLLRLEPTREQTHRRLARLYALNGERGAALLQLERCAGLLEREFGVAPTAATLALAAQIRAGELDAAPEDAGGIARELAQLRERVVALQGEVELLKRSLERLA